MPQFGGEKSCDRLGHGDSGIGIEEQGAGAAGENIFDAACHFILCGPDHLCRDVWEFRMELHSERRESRARAWIASASEP